MDLVQWMQTAFDVNVFVETGTYRGHTASWAAAHFNTVITIEGSEQYHKSAKAIFGHLRNISFLHGDSAGILRETLHRVNQKAIIWLDAHYCGADTYGKDAECPVISEMRTINESPNDHLVLVDDARLFTSPPPAEHNAEHWPDLVELVGAMSPPNRPRYLTIVDDVLIAVPLRDKKLLSDYVRVPSPANVARSAG